MEANLHSEWVERALAGYAQTHGPDAPQPSRSTSYETIHQGRRYIVLGNARRILTVYRVPRDGSLRLLVSWPRALRDLHRERSAHYAHRST